MLKFVNDYCEGAHQEILNNLQKTNLEKITGYGLDVYSGSARNKIRAACGKPDAEVYFLVGGTQTNETVISSVLKQYQGVLAADTGHINTHEAGAIEHGGHKVLTLEQKNGKISAKSIWEYDDKFQSDLNNEHEVAPGMVYISQPTEYGTLYSLAELKEIRRACDEIGLVLYIDGARLGYALSCDENDASLKDIADIADVFTIGGTKCGAMLGEAVVFTKPGLVPHFYTITKIHGAMLAKGWIIGLSFDTLFTDDLYIKICRNANETAARIREALFTNGYDIYIDSPTNQIFPVVTPEKAAELSENVEYGFMETLDDGRQVIRFCTSWATTMEDVDKLIEIL